MLRPGFEPESSARKADMIGRTTLPEHEILFMNLSIYTYIDFRLMGPMGFEPMAARL